MCPKFAAQFENHQEMNLTNLVVKHNSKIWIGLFALLSGTFVTGMTGHISLASNYPIALLIAVLMNLVIASFLLNVNSAFGEITFYQKIRNMFSGNTGKLFGGFTGILILIILLMVAVGEAREGMIVINAISQGNIGNLTSIILVCSIALIPLFFGLKVTFRYAFVLFLLLILTRSFFSMYFFLGADHVPSWQIANVLNFFDQNYIYGSSGLAFMAFKLAFWSVVGIEILALMNKKAGKFFTSPANILLACLFIIVSWIPGIAMAGVFPVELWQLIINSDQACNGSCISIALGQYMVGQQGAYFMAVSSILTSIGLLSICYVLISKLIWTLSRQKLFFGALSKGIHPERNNNHIPKTTLLLSFIIIMSLSLIDKSAGDWLGLGLYISFGLMLGIQILCLLNMRFHWLKEKETGSSMSCMLTGLSLILFAIIFYTGFKGEHQKYFYYSLALLCFSLWVAATSLVYILKLQRD